MSVNHLLPGQEHSHLIFTINSVKPQHTSSLVHPNLKGRNLHFASKQPCFYSSAEALCLATIVA